MKRLILIGIFSLLMLVFLYTWSLSYYTSQEEAYVKLQTEEEVNILPNEYGVFRRSNFANDYSEMNKTNNSEKTLDSYYSNRAYHGAPPYIPHPILDDRNLGGQSCLKCHENGGFVAKFKAYTPVVPHPELVNCRQCHVTQNTNELFTGFNFENQKDPSIGNAEFNGSPPIVPHQIQMHENCLSCHAGPSAPIEIRVSHPERSNCLQCHVINNKEMTDIGLFSRKKK